VVVAHPGTHAGAVAGGIVESARGGVFVIGWVFGLARMLGLGAAAGTRPWLTLALVGVMSGLGWGVPLNSAFDWLGNRWVLLVLAVLAILEAAFDKIVRVDRLQDRMVFPLRLAAGAVAGAATIDAGWPGLLIGLAVGGFAAWLAEHVKHVRRPRATRSEATIPLLSLIEDLYVLLGTVGTLAWSPVGLAVVAWPAALWVEMRRRRKAKYAALRRRRDPREPPVAATVAPPSGAAPGVPPPTAERGVPPVFVGSESALHGVTSGPASHGAAPHGPAAPPPLTSPPVPPGAEPRAAPYGVEPRSAAPLDSETEASE
jgi:uncharacterized membrane protein